MSESEYRHLAAEARKWPRAGLEGDLPATRAWNAAAKAVILQISAKCVLTFYAVEFRHTFACWNVC
jgi:hypothetical protein